MIRPRIRWLMRLLAGMMLGYGTYVAVTDGAAGLIALTPILLIHVLVAVVVVPLARYRKRRGQGAGRDFADDARHRTCASHRAALARDN